MVKKFISDLKNEFKGYNGAKLGNDIMAGLTVTAVALPLALAFGVSCGADAAAGLITAIIAGLVIGALSGASYQISGPTGAMTAILIGVVTKYQMPGVFLACLLAGAILLVAGLFKIGKLVSYIPGPVIAGFTSGIAVIIAAGQIDNFFGSTSEGEGVIGQFVSYFTNGFHVNWGAVAMGVLVVVVMIIWPKKWNARFPSSLVGIILALVANMILKLDVAVVGEIPKTLFPEVRLTFSNIPFNKVGDLISPAISIAALGMIESLLCGAAAGKMKGEKLDADRELVAQGIGNMLIPFFGGVPATAAIARTSVAIKSGCVTRLTSIFHAVGLLASMFLLGSVMSQIPLAALAGVLMVTAWRMNEWDEIKRICKKKFKSAIAMYFITMISTVIFDLTVAIVIGVVFSVFSFVVSVADISIDVSDVDENRLKARGIDLTHDFGSTKMVTLTGPVFFATVEKLESQLSDLSDVSMLIFSMRGVPMMDISGADALLELLESYEIKNINVVFTGVQPKVRTMFERSGILELVGEDNIHSDFEKAMMRAQVLSSK